jgi:O-antigen/teichoic acid export membrane protein
MKDLKQKTIRSGMARLCAQGANFVLRVGSLMVLARLLDPNDFGLVGMVTAFTGVLSLFRDFGLSAAAIQRATVTEDQISALFWINLLVGALLAVLSLVLAPAFVAFYHEPRIFGLTAVLAASFLFNAAGVQHMALLQRQMRFTALAIISTLSLIISTAIAIYGAKAGYGYWALVAMTVSIPLSGTLGFWLTARWIPGMPRRHSGIRNMMRFGGTLTINGLVYYVINNIDKVLLGRFCGPNALGIYGRAYQFASIPTDNLNAAASDVAFAALSRLQDDPVRLKSYFLKGYSLVLAMTLPITIACAFFSNDVIAVLLGSKWSAASSIFRSLAPAIIVLAIVNPLGWLLPAIGLVGRGLKMALTLAPLMIAGIIIGLRYGPNGVAIAYSSVMLIWLVPAIIWAVHGTPIKAGDIWLNACKPLIAGFAASALAFSLQLLCGQFGTSLRRLVIFGSITAAAYLVLLLYVMGQKAFYLDLLRTFRKGSSVSNDEPVSA